MIVDVEDLLVLSYKRADLLDVDDFHPLLMAMTNLKKVASSDTAKIRTRIHNLFSLNVIQNIYGRFIFNI